MRAEKYDMKEIKLNGYRKSTYILELYYAGNTQISCNGISGKCIDDRSLIKQKYINPYRKIVSYIRKKGNGMLHS